jgi:HTH-type transcriptional regulator/antitoxin HigA
VITNERQYKITKAALTKLEKALSGFDSAAARAAVGNPKLVEIQLNALQSEHAALHRQLQDYEALKSGVVSDFHTDSLEELPEMLIKARIATGMSQAQLAEKIGVKEQQIQRYESEKYSSASLRRILEVADALGLDVSKHARLRPRGSVEAGSKTSTEVNWSRFPIKEMYRRGWFPDFVGSAQEAGVNAADLIRPLITIANRPWAEALHKKHVRSNSRLDDYALLAWECRVLALAKEQQANRFDQSKLTKDWVHELVKLSREKDSAVRAREFLATIGIILVVEPHLPQTYLDGACIKTPSQVVIGMTLRYDRLDNFWFVLIHEVAHSILHANNTGIASFFDDVDVRGDQLEQEADAFASESLVPNDIWETAVARYTRSAEAIRELARELQISPALIAGRIRREADNYVILNQLVGIGAVRKQFPEVNFGI